MNAPNVPLRKIRLALARYQYRKLSVLLGFTIPFNCFEEGLSLPHYGGIIVNGGVKVGKNCSIRPFTVIGNKRDGANKEVPTIGNNVTIGANVSIIGKITIGDNVTIGAGSVVVNNVPSNSVVVGNPAHIIKYI